MTDPLRPSWPTPSVRHGRPDRPSATLTPVMADLIGHLSPCCRHGRPRPAICYADARHGRLDRPSPACRDAVPSLSRRKRGQPGRWTSQLLLLRPRPSAWPVTSSNKLRPAASGVTAPSPGPRAFPFPPIRSGISAPPPSWPPFRCHGLPGTVMAALPSFVRPETVMAGPDRPSLPPSRHFWLFLLA